MAKLDDLIQQKQQRDEDWKAKKTAEREELGQLSDDAVMHVTSEPGAYLHYLDTQAINPRYSASNVLLAMAQNPEITYINSLEVWNRLGRSVNRDEDGMKIRVSDTYVKDGREYHGYKIGRVFDISQTHGKAGVPALSLKDNTPEMDAALRRLLDSSPVPVVTSSTMYQDAVYDPKTQSITVSSRLIDSKIFAALSREIVHAGIHDHGRYPYYTREDCAMDAESVSYMLCRNFGVEVFFVSDNIWTMDGDGELRLSIMATMAQEESRKISERVLAGQKISRQNGVLYGSGNIIGYDRDKVNRTYVINEEQAATIRMVFTLYSQGYGEKAIVNELSRLGRKDGHGNVSWSCTKISRILRNATYMGYVCYNKSKVNNYLEKKRINNLDETSFVYVKGNFEPIVSESLWHECERIRKSRISSLRLPDGETRRKGARTTKNLWVSKLRCRCGSSYRIFNWRKLKDGTPVFGYQCNMRTVNPTRSFVLEHNMTQQLSCDAISIPEWKLELMAKKIFEKVWGNQNKAILRACKMIESLSLIHI